MNLHVGLQPYSIQRDMHLRDNKPKYDKEMKATDRINDVPAIRILHMISDQTFA